MVWLVDRTMDCLIAYYSRFGNTELIAEAIGRGLESAGCSAKLVGLGQVLDPGLRKANLLIAGCPTHKMGLPVAVRQELDAWGHGALTGISVAAFDTSYRMNWLLARFTAARRMDKRLRRLGGRRVACPESFHVMESEGPLIEGEVERAREWAAAIVSQLDGARREEGRWVAGVRDAWNMGEVRSCLGSGPASDLVELGGDPSEDH
jgi:flavodoxin